jgi:hypothetical protein
LIGGADEIVSGFEEVDGVASTRNGAFIGHGDDGGSGGSNAKAKRQTRQHDQCKFSHVEFPMRGRSKVIGPRRMPALRFGGRLLYSVMKLFGDQIWTCLGGAADPTPAAIPRWRLEQAGVKRM